MKPLNSIMLSGKEALPLIEGGKGVAISNWQSSGAWAAMGGIGTVSCVNADSYDDDGNIIRQIYHARTRRERHEEMVEYGIAGGIAQIRRAYDLACGNGRLHMNVLWEMGAAERVLEGILDKAKGLVSGVTCGAGMPYRLAEVAARFGVYIYPIISSARAFGALWKRTYHKYPETLGGVVYEDPWKAGGHNGLSNKEDPLAPQDPYPRVLELRQLMRTLGLGETPIVMAGGVWCLDEWENWIDNPELGPIVFQFGSRPLVTQESPISAEWKQRLLNLTDGEVSLHRFSPTGFYSSSIRNSCLHELEERSARQISYTTGPDGAHTDSFNFGARKRLVYVAPEDKAHAERWQREGFTECLRTPDSTLVFMTLEKSKEIRQDQIDCMGCLSACRFSNWSQSEPWSTGKKADPRSFCIQKTLQDVAHEGSVEHNLAFSGHNAYRFSTDPYYRNGFIPTVRELFERIVTGK
ncbi:MAG TPA: nitronate monooxygenase [Sneathiellales bacterium]|nr:nitronate monooxygenase [Sneathiellales bacterium]